MTVSPFQMCGVSPGRESGQNLIGHRKESRDA
jgi:hypothetical protein